MNKNSHPKLGKISKVIKISKYAKNLPNYVDSSNSKIKSLEESRKQHSADLESVNKKLNKVSLDLNNLESLTTRIDGAISDFKHQALLSRGQDKYINKITRVNDTIADNPKHDRFYKEFEDKFRGTEEDIKKRLEEYLPYLNRLSKAAKLLPVIDLGCGRGEFLAVVTNLGMKAIGIDMNETMVDRAKELGYEAFKTDALSYLYNQKPNSCSVISGFHIVEHIPFNDLLLIFDECYRVVGQDGFILFETPNPINLTVGAANFYMDPSHIKPIPPELLSYALESSGFYSKILPLHPVIKNIDHPDPIVKSIMGMVYGPQDYAVLASKKPFDLI